MTLSTYIGFRAIAWIIHTDKEIIQYGIKRINVPFDNYYEFIAGLPVSKRINRRMKRQMRRNLWRYKSRRDNLRFFLKKNLGVEPKSHCTREEILNYRVACLDHEMSHEVLATVLMSLQQRRGYKSFRGVSDNENSDYLKEIERHEENLKKYRSIGEYLRILPSSKNIIFNRQSYINEFNAIMDRQHLPDEIRKKLFNIIYYQRPLKKGKIAKCDYEKNREVIHASHPLYQEFRIWRDVMNIIIWDSEKNELEISFQQRKKWMEKLMNGANLTKASCLKDLGIKRSTQYSWLSGKQIAGNPLSYLYKLSTQQIGNVETLWQELFSAVDTDKLATFLRSKYCFDDYVINELIDLDFSKLGYGEFSAKAIRKLLPQLQQGKKLKHAIFDIYGKIDFDNVMLRNIILEQHFDAYKALVEGLKKKYEIDEIKFEIDHLFKIGNKGRKALAKQKRSDEKFLKENIDILNGRSSYDILKFKLWKESEGISPYEPDKKIPLEKLFTKEYNIDHLVAKSMLFETGYNNMVLAKTALNEKKGRMTALDFARSLNLNGEYDEVIEKFPESKQEFLKMSYDNIPNNWISKRQNNDYNTKCFATITSSLRGGTTKQSLNIPNKLINKYLNEWSLNQYTDQDARHYLCRAFIIANFNQDTIEYFDNIKDQEHNIYNLTPDLPILYVDFENPPISMPRIKFTRKTKYGYHPRFALHGETVFGKRVKKCRNSKGQISEDVFYKIRQPVSKLTPPMVEKIMDEAIKRKIKRRIAEKGNHEEAIQSLVEDPATHNGNPIRSISIIQNAERIYPLHSTDGNGNTGPKNKCPIPCDFVFSDKNHRLVLKQNEKGKLNKECITLMQFVDGLNEGLEMRKKGEELFERSIIELDGEKYFIIGASDALTLRSIYTLSATDSRKVKTDDWKKLKKLLINQLGEVLHKKQLLEAIEETTIPSYLKT